jgi:hypothetical protein
MEDTLSRGDGCRSAVDEGRTLEDLEQTYLEVPLKRTMVARARVIVTLQHTIKRQMR